MFEKRIQIEEGDRLILVEMRGSVNIDVWDEASVLIRWRGGEERDLVVDRSEAGPAISARGS